MTSIFANIKVEIPQEEKIPEKPRKKTGYIFKKKEKEVDWSKKMQWVLKA